MTKPLKIAFYTLGCKVNQYETEAIKEKFQDRGHEDVPVSSDLIDGVVINTCTVTNMADRKSRQLMRRAKKNNPNCVVAVIGCYSQIKPDEVREIDEVDLVLGNVDKDKVVDLMEGLLISEEVKAISAQYEFQELGVTRALESRSRAYVKIQEGCNRFCSYCIIPYARGPIRSRKIDNIIEEVASLVEAGYKELILTGINTALYGMEGLKEDDYVSRLPIEDLLEKIELIPGEFRVRFSSLEPTVVNKHQVENLLKYKRLCNSFHLSMQSGSDNVLKEMNRSYLSSDYLDIVKALRQKDPTFGISADIIVGFPGETSEDFKDSLQVMKESLLCRTHVFKYSKRDGTPAADRKDQIDEKIKTERSEELILASEKTAEKFNSLLIGRVAEVLIETENEETGLFEGYTRNYVKAYVSSQAGENLLGKLINITVNDIYKDGVKGEL